MPGTVVKTDLPDLPVRRGKVRDIYDLGEQLLIVATDRISAFDVVLPTPIPDKGIVLTQISAFWFERFSDRIRHHMEYVVTPQRLPAGLEPYVDQLAGRAMVCRKAQVVPIECVVRGYLAGSGWAEYQRSGEVCGIKLPAGLRRCEKLPEPIFTPATKATAGHDENISFERACQIAGKDLMRRIRDLSIDLYLHASEYASQRGIIIADTKFEWGLIGGELVLIDEVLTPDSSRFWPADQYEPGRDQPNFDKQFVRNYLQRLCDEGRWNKQPPGPELPDDVVEQTRARYVEAYERLTGRKFSRPTPCS